MNMIESFLVQMEEKTEHKKTKGIVESDVKLFNFLLDSDR
jgi:hypothetical protein